MPGDTLEDGVNDQLDSLLPHKRNESLRKRSQSSLMRSDSSNNSAAHLSATSLAQDGNRLPEESHSTSSVTAKKVKTVVWTPSSSKYPPQTPPSNSANKPRNRAVTNSVSNSSARKSPHLNSTSSGPRRPLQATGSTMNRQASTPLKKPPASTPPTRVRSSSTSLLSNSIQYEWDENSKPPWLDESPTYLYKSDIADLQPGSLADIARHAQGRSQTSTEADGDVSFLGDTSIRS